MQARSVATRTAVVGLALACLAVVRLLLGVSAAGFALDALAAAAAVLGAVAAQRLARNARSRRAWSFQWAAPLAWLVAAVACALALPAAVEYAGRVAFVLLAATAWWLTSLGRDTWSRIRLVIDAAMAGASAFIVGWPLVLRRMWEQGPGGFAGLLDVALPLAALAVAVLATGIALTEMHRSRRLMPACYVAGLVTVAASDVARGVGATPLWAIGFALMFLGTRVYVGTSQRREVISTRRALVHAPYVILAPAVVTLAWEAAAGGVPGEMTTVSVVMAALLLARQHVTLSENRGLVARLAATEQQLRHQATHDSLTGLPGRVVLWERLDTAVRARGAGTSGLAIAFLDLDDFKEVNDTLGHAAGDDVLVETARRLRAVLAPLGADATPVRMSGDEFAVLLVGGAAEAAGATASAVLEAISRPIEVNGHVVRVGGSVGVATAEHGEVDPSDLLRAADVAMYAVKHHGKGGVEVAPPVHAGGAVAEDEGATA